MTKRRKDRWCSTLSHLLVRGLVLAVPVSLIAAGVLAVVTITGFVVEAGDSEIFVNWETASEIDNLGFYVWRSQTEATGYVKVPLDAPSEQFIPSQDDYGVGALYEFIDAQVTPGTRYYYKVEDVPASGGNSEMVGPESAMIPLPATATSTPGPSQPTPMPGVQFWADPAQVSAGGCSTVLWQTENVQAVYFDGEGVPGEGARAFCPCVEEVHVLRVQYRDGRWEDTAVTIGVTGTCGSGTGASPLATPTGLPTVLPTNTRPAVGSEVQLTATPRSTSMPAVEQPLVSPIDTPPPSIALPGAAVGTAEGTVEGMIQSPLASPTPSVTSTRAPVALIDGSAVEAGGASRFPLLWIGLALALVFGVALVVGGLWLWKRGR